MLILFVLIEARFAPSPIVPLRTFRRRSLSVANVLSATAGLVVFGNYFFLSLYLQEVKHYSPLRAGLAFLPIGLTTFAGALVASRLVHRLGIRWQLVIAPLITAAAVYWLSQLSPGSSYFGSLFVPLVLAGASIGVTFVPMTMAATTGVPPAEGPGVRPAEHQQTARRRARPRRPGDNRLCGDTARGRTRGCCRRRAEPRLYARVSRHLCHGCGRRRRCRLSSPQRARPVS